MLKSLVMGYIAISDSMYDILRGIYFTVLLLSTRKQTFYSLPTNMPLLYPLAVQQKFWGTLELISIHVKNYTSTSKVMTVLVTLDPTTRLKDLTVCQ